MLISYKWLQSYFEDKLPSPEKLAGLLTEHLCEVEGIEKAGDDTVLNIKILPDRACYLLSHRGVAYEVSAITGLPKKDIKYEMPKVVKVRSLSVKVEASDLCSRYMARVVENVTSKELSWVKEHLEAVGQRSINPIVDGANIVMFDRGQPLHAFDADKVEGGIVVRRARAGEKLITLDNREVALNESILVIADDKSPLALAGIKGGKKAEVTSETKNIILESASFNPSYIRLASAILGIKTEASKRFENGLSADMAGEAMDDFSAYLFEMDKNLKAGEIVDWHRDKLKVLKLKVEKADIVRKIGMEISEKEIEEIFTRLLFEFKKEKDGWWIFPPLFRADITIPEDVAEEVARLVGYEKIPVVFPDVSGARPAINKNFYYENKIRDLLVGLGFSEVMTTSFAEKALVEIANPLASDKKYLRDGLSDNIRDCLKKNGLNADLLQLDAIKIFEIGKVFDKTSEQMRLAIGLNLVRKVKGGDAVKSLTELLQGVSDSLSVDFSEADSVKGDKTIAWCEMSIDEFIEKMSEPKEWDIAPSAVSDKTFAPISVYPFISRDIAVFVPVGEDSDDVLKLIKKEAGGLLINIKLFDSFKKGDKVSFAFRLVFQSQSRTLSDGEVNAIMDKISAVLNGKKGFQVR